MNLPGYDEAGELGYTLNMSGGDKSWATYCNNKGIFLTVYDDDTCKIEAFPGLLTISTGKLSFPHSNFSMFENQVKRAFYNY